MVSAERCMGNGGWVVKWNTDTQDGYPEITPIAFCVLSNSNPVVPNPKSILWVWGISLLPFDASGKI